MITYVLAYFTLFYGIYFLGHFCMSMAYGMGLPATNALAAILFISVVVTLWKASGGAEKKKEAVWGILAGFFLWCFFGEFLEHERILSLVTPDAAVMLIPCILLISCIIYKRAVPIGMRFALGHFGCIWLLHALMINGEKVLQDYIPALRTVFAAGTGLVFLLISLLMLYKTFRAGSNNARLACMLPSFIFFWATMETLQAIDVLPDYTCYAFWTGSSASGTKTCPREETVEKKIAQMKKHYAWKDQQAEKRAWALVNKLPSQHLIDDFAQRLEQRLARAGGTHIDEGVFYRVMEESFIKSGTSAFTRLLKARIQQFKAAAVPGRESHPEYAAYPAGVSYSEDMEEKTAFIQERYTWDTVRTRHLAGYLMNRFSIQFLNGDEFIKKLDSLLEGAKTDTLTEEMFCRAMEDHFAALCRLVFRNLMKHNIPQPG